jgi:hypothetical protein
MAENKLTTDTHVEIAAEILFTEIQAEAVLLNVESGLYYGLNEVGAHMWALLQEFGCLGAVHQRLLDEYEVAPEPLWEDLVSLVRELLAEGMLRIDAGQAA